MLNNAELFAVTQEIGILHILSYRSKTYEERTGDREVHMIIV